MDTMTLKYFLHRKKQLILWRTWLLFEVETMNDVHVQCSSGMSMRWRLWVRLWMFLCLHRPAFLSSLQHSQSFFMLLDGSREYEVLNSLIIYWRAFWGSDRWRGSRHLQPILLGCSSYCKLPVLYLGARRERMNNAPLEHCSSEYLAVVDTDL